MIEKEEVGSVNDLEHLLSTILVPSFPPNRSQWKKLEIALKFINKSKKSASLQNIEKKNKDCHENSRRMSKSFDRNFNEEEQPYDRNKTDKNLAFKSFCIPDYNMINDAKKLIQDIVYFFKYFVVNSTIFMLFILMMH